MPTLPIPVFAAFVLAFAALRLWQEGRTPLALVLLLAIASAQSLIIALSQHYGLAGMRYVQPLTASFIPPAAWLAYQTAAVRPWQGTDLIHLLTPALTIASLLVAPAFLDVLLPGAFVLYGALIVLRAGQGADAQPNTLLASGDLPGRIWLLIGAALLGSAFSDVLIVLANMTGQGAWKPWIITIFSVCNLLLIGLVSLSPHLQSGTPVEGEKVTTPAEPDEALWQRVQALMAAERPYLDPDLTLLRLSRKLGVPAKALSSTINRATGDNVSRYINAARIAAAQEALAGGEAVTSAMFSAGFQTKSNFNREFLRVTGQSPTSWIKAQRSDPP